MTKDLALLVGPDQKWLSTTGYPRQGRREPEEGDGGISLIFSCGYRKRRDMVAPFF